jgi:hypothetical protein
MSGYTSGNNAPTLMAQAPNRKGNISKHVVGTGGVTAVTRPKGNTSYSSPTQGKPSVGGSVTAGRGQKVTVVTQCDYDGTARNTGYLKNSSYTK